MKYFVDILKMFDETNLMNFCDDFGQIQSILNDCNSSVRPLQKIQHRGGNEIYIEDIVKRLQVFLLSKGYLHAENKKPNYLEHDQELRKITFFLILNTDLNLKYNLMEDRSICHLINITPQLPKFLLFTCIWELQLNHYLCENISYLPLWFTLQLIDNSTDILKSLDSFQIINNVEKVVQAIFINIARSDFYSLNTVEHKIFLNKFYDISMGYLRYFFTPDSSQIEKMKEMQQSFYLGYVVKHILSLTLNCFNIYLTKPEFMLAPHYHLYSVMKEKEKSTNNHIVNYSSVVRDSLHRTLVSILNALQHNVMQITLSCFMDWVEKDLDEETTLQSAVGNLAFHVYEILVSDTDFKHDVANQLNNFSIKPLTIEEKASNATLGQIMKKLDDPNLDDTIKQIFIKEFILRGILVLDNQECLDAIAENVKCLTVEMVRDMLVFISKQSDSDSIDQKLCNIINDSMDNFSIEEIKKIVIFISGLNVKDALELDTFDTNLTELLNKSTNGFCIRSTLKVLCQNPAKAFQKLFIEALKNQQHMNNFMKFIVEIQEISQQFLEENVNDLVIEQFSKINENEVKLIPKFINEIYATDIMSKDVIISKILYKSMVVALNERNYAKILILMNTFCAIGHKNHFGKLNSPVLVMAAQVLNHCRWDIITYTEELETIVIRSIEFIQDILKKVLPTATVQDKQWILSKINSFSNMTKYYFQKLSLLKDDRVKTFDEFLQNTNRQSQNKSSICMFLLENLVRSTKKEAMWIAKNPIYLPHFTSTILTLKQVISETNISNSINCFRHCIQCYITIVKELILPSIENSKKRIELLKELIFVLNELQNISIYAEVFMCMYPVVIEVAEKALPDLIECAESIKESISNLKMCEAQILTLTKFESVLCDSK